MLIMKMRQRIIQPGCVTLSMKLLQRDSILQSDSVSEQKVKSFRDSEKPLFFHSSGELEDGPVAWLRKRSLSVP